jgi:molybdenum-dependent DNA-binding transcriptional regulator ModE
MLRDRLATLINSADPGLARQGRDELAAALKKGGGVRQTAKSVGIPERTLWRWIRLTGVEPPNERLASFTDAELRAAIRTGKSATGAARALGVTHTTVLRRAAALGIELQDGRAMRPVRSKRQPV